jgi:hypothetical protein
MSELAQRIVASHKSAAKRAVFHLGKTRKLKMSSTESLELVACILGVANWQTLLAMAKEGRGPRIDDGTLVAAAPVKEQSDAEKLADYYGTADSWGEHPYHTREDWSHEVEEGNTGLSYWEHVANEIDSRNEMFPWERDASLDCKLAKLGAYAVVYEPVVAGETQLGWCVLSPATLEFVITECHSEEEAWQLAAIEVRDETCHQLDISHQRWAILFDREKIDAVTRANAIISGDGQEPSDELDNGYRLLRGEMTKDSRKFSQAVSLCRELGFKAVYTDEKEDEGKFWEINGDFYATEEEAWDGQARIVRNAVCVVLEMETAAWDSYDFGTKISLASRNWHWAYAINPDFNIGEEAETALDQEAQEIARLVQTDVERHDGKWIVTQSRIKEMLDYPPQDNVHLVWRAAALAAMRSTAKQQGITLEQLSSGGPIDRMRTIESTFQGLPIHTK